MLACICGGFEFLLIPAVAAIAGWLGWKNKKCKEECCIDEKQ